MGMEGRRRRLSVFLAHDTGFTHPPRRAQAQVLCSNDAAAKSVSQQSKDDFFGHCLLRPISKSCLACLLLL